MTTHEEQDLRGEVPVAFEISDAQFLREIADRIGQETEIEGATRLRDLADRLEAQERAQE